MLFDKFENLPHLVRLSLSLEILDIYDFGHIGMLVNVVTSTGSRQSKAKRFDQRCQFLEANILRSTQDFVEQFASVHCYVFVASSTIRISASISPKRFS